MSTFGIDSGESWDSPLIRETHSLQDSRSFTKKHPEIKTLATESHLCLHKDSLLLSNATSTTLPEAVVLLRFSGMGMAAGTLAIHG